MEETLNFIKSLSYLKWTDKTLLLSWSTVPAAFQLCNQTNQAVKNFSGCTIVIINPSLAAWLRELRSSQPAQTSDTQQSTEPLKMTLKWDVAQHWLSEAFSSNLSIIPSCVKYSVIQSVPLLPEGIINASSYYGRTQPTSFASVVLCQTLYICNKSWFPGHFRVPLHEQCEGQKHK